jgi:hypothetical protein
MQVAPELYLRRNSNKDKENTMKLAAALLLVALFPALLPGQAPQAYRTVHSSSTNGFSIHTKFFDAIEGNRLQASVSCNFVDSACLASPPVYWDGVHKTYRHFVEIVSLHQLNVLAGTQQQFFALTIKPLTRKQIQVIAPGAKLFAGYTLLVQEDTSIETK